MTPHEIVRILQERFGGKITLALPDDRHPRVHIDAGDWRPAANPREGSNLVTYLLGALSRLEDAI